MSWIFSPVRFHSIAACTAFPPCISICTLNTMHHHCNCAQFIVDFMFCMPNLSLKCPDGFGKAFLPTIFFIDHPCRFVSGCWELDLEAQLTEMLRVKKCANPSPHGPRRNCRATIRTVFCFYFVFLCQITIVLVTFTIVVVKIKTTLLYITRQRRTTCGGNKRRALSWLKD